MLGAAFVAFKAVVALRFGMCRRDAVSHASCRSRNPKLDCWVLFVLDPKQEFLLLRVAVYREARVQKVRC